MINFTPITLRTLICALVLLGSAEVVRAQATLIKIDAATNNGTIHPEIYGSNHRFTNNGSTMWDPVSKQAFPKFVSVYNEVGLRSMRYPAGTAASLFFWKRSIGPLENRSNIINGKSWEENTGSDFPNFGLDEAARFCEENNTKLNYMYNFGNGNAADAADLVEYLNAPLGTNPNGGIAWAEERAKNGHPAPYNIKTFEMGNEMYPIARQHYWLDGTTPQNYSYEYKYCFGAEVSFVKQGVGEYANNSISAARSRNTANQVKYIKYPVVLPGTATVYVNDVAWTRVNSLAGQGKTNVYTLDETSGKITFGDGVDGTIPPANTVITASYTSRRDGFDDYYRAMKAVDPTIKIYSCLVDRKFINTMGTSPYDGIAMHPYALPGHLPKTETVENYHDLIMQLSDEEADSIKHTKEYMRMKASPDRRDSMHVICSEYGLDFEPTPGYGSSINQALFSARIVMAGIDQDSPLTNKHSLTSTIISNAPHFFISPTGYMFKMFTSLFGPTRISSSIENNPKRPVVANPYLTRVGKPMPYLDKLAISASKDARGNVYLMVLNRDREDAVTSVIQLSDYHITDSATIWTLKGPNYLSTNTASNPHNVSIKESRRRVGTTSFEHTFPPHSITAIKLSGIITPIAPANLQGSVKSQSQIEVHWRDDSDNESGFVLERSAGQDSSFTELVTLPANVTTYLDKNLMGSTTYFYRVRAVNEAGASAYSTTTSATTLAEGTGLLGTYYKSKHFNGRSFTRVDSTVNFDWGMGAPDTSLSQNTFSIRWQGQVEAPDEGTYTFHTETDDGVRLWVDGQLLIDQWEKHQGLQQHSAGIRLESGKQYDLKLEYFENDGHAAAKLYWSGEGLPRQIIPEGGSFRLLLPRYQPERQ